MSVFVFCIFFAPIMSRASCHLHVRMLDCGKSKINYVPVHNIMAGYHEFPIIISK